jgi:hypothetical protein
MTFSSAGTGFSDFGIKSILSYLKTKKEESMRFIAIAALAASLVVPAAMSASYAAQNTDISAAKKKAKPKKEKVEYMRAVPAK